MQVADKHRGRSVAYFRKYVVYDHDTGKFTWLVRLGKARPGAVAGTRHVHGYTILGIHGEHYLAHRLAWFMHYGVWPKDQIDHINGVKDDNRISNLREASKAENQWNVAGLKSSTSGFKGAKLDRRDGKYDASIRVRGRSYHLGRFPTAEEAHAAYCKAAAKFHGEFARTE